MTSPGLMPNAGSVRRRDAAGAQRRFRRRRSPRPPEIDPRPFAVRLEDGAVETVVVLDALPDEVEAISVGWGADLLPDGKVVWAQLG